ncbi:MAG: hypothetical protein VX589_04915 [Myxococcota bacterium]|nr:hypothetical protein [Myxococcota bacterium]
MTDEYVQRIGDAFIKHSRRGLMLSPRDRMIIERWQRAGIPLDVVMTGLNDAFANPPRRRVTSIAFARPAVERAQAAWRNRDVGGQSRCHNTGQENSTAFAYLIAALTEVSQRQSDIGIGRCIMSLVGQVEHLNASRLMDAEIDVDSQLEALEDGFCDAVLSLLDQDVVRTMHTEIEGTLASMSWSSNHARQASKRAYLRRRIRRYLGTPVLQLTAVNGWS